MAIDTARTLDEIGQPIHRPLPGAPDVQLPERPVWPRVNTRRMSHSVAAPVPRFAVKVPDAWPHVDGPLHALLAFQDGKCAVCAAPATWAEETGGVAACSLKQWVEDDLLMGLVCALCCRRYKTLGKQPQGAAIEGLPAFLAAPPGQRCETTRGLGGQSRPRRFNSRLAPTEVPTPSVWTYHSTVMHSLFLWQRGRCAICSTGLAVATRPRSVHVDHEEPSGLIRGLLCHRCNTCLGQDWEVEWWEHHAPVVEAYLATPPAQIFPGTRGLTTGERARGAHMTWSADRQEILLDGMPLSIQGVTAPAVGTAKSANHWYAVRYTDSAPNGLPGVLEASLLVPYSDEEGSWFAFLLDPPPNASTARPRCILRVKEADVVEVTEHISMREALTAGYGERD